jgi:molybdate/tungstate transport system substrate-binding protein
MKKLVVFSLVVLFVFSITIGVSPVKGDTKVEGEISVGKTSAVINSEVVKIDVAPIISNGRTLISGSFLANNLGGFYDYNPNSKTITLLFDLKVFTFEVGSKKAIIDNENYETLDVAPAVIKGVPLVPLRFVIESLGGIVMWNGNTRSVKLSYAPKPLSKTLNVTLKVIHAGSLTQPIRSVEENFKNYYKNLNVQINFEDMSAGSVDAVKQVSELKKEMDVVITADSFLIPQYLIPAYASWYTEFATNKLVLCYTDKSAYAEEITSNNWFDILLRKDVEFGYSEPNSDPCGYRTLLMFQLAELFYKKPGLYNSLLNATKPQNIRPKSVELVALLQTHELDYAFEYESVAIQNNLKYISFKDELNFGNPELKDWYAKASLTLKDGTVVKGAPIVYGLTIPKNAPSKIWAERFVMYLLKYGKDDFKKAGQPFVDFKAYPDIYNIPTIVRIGIRN